MGEEQDFKLTLLFPTQPVEHWYDQTTKTRLNLKDAFALENSLLYKIVLPWYIFSFFRVYLSTFLKLLALFFFCDKPVIEIYLH